MDTMISALGVLVDGVDTRDDTARDIAVRAAALDAAISHLAGDGCKVADSTGNGNAVVGCARTFERYLTGETAEMTAELLLNINDALRQAYRLLRTGPEASNRDELLDGIDTLIGRIGAERDDERDERRRSGDESPRPQADTIAIPWQELRLVVGALADVVDLLRAADFHEQDDAEAWAQRRDTAVGMLTGLYGQLDDRAGGR